MDFVLILDDLFYELTNTTVRSGLLEFCQILQDDNDTVQVAYSSCNQILHIQILPIQIIPRPRIPILKSTTQRLTSFVIMPTPSSTENHPTEKIPRAKKPTPKKIMVASRYAQQNTTTAPHVRKPSQLSSTRMVKKAPAAKNTIVAKPRQRVDSKPTKSTHVDHKEARRKPGIPAEKPIPKRVSNTTTTPVNQTDQLEMEIRANLYYQLCFCRAKTHTSFVALKAKAEVNVIVSIVLPVGITILF